MANKKYIFIITIFIVILVVAIIITVGLYVSNKQIREWMDKNVFRKEVEQDTAIVDKISSEEVVDEINEIEADNINNEEMKNDNTNKTENVVFMIIGTILAIVVIGVVIIGIKKRV